jgi:cytochrome c-type biogenesis protein CcmH
VTEFVLMAAVMVAVALIVLLPPLLRGRRAGAAVDQQKTNLAILKDQLAELDRDQQAGRIDPAAYAETRADLERRVLEETQAGGGAPAGSGHGPRWVAVAVAVALPVVAGLLYARFGDPNALNPALMQTAAAGGDAHGTDAKQIEDMIQALEERLKKEPDNANGWATLARTYYAQGRFDLAANAYAKLAALIPDNADILADQADALAMARGRKIAGEPLALVQKALKLDPKQWKALAIAGTEAFDRQDYKGAVDYWERLQKSLPPDAPIGQQIVGSIDEARKLGGMPPAPRTVPPTELAQGKLPANHPPLEAQKGAPAAAAGATIGGTVDLGAEFKAKAQPSDIVLIFARAAEGSRMPLALTRVQVKDLPAKFTLDESMAMSPNMTIASVPEVIVGARISRSGAPMPTSGDLEGLSKPVKVGAKDVAVTIDRVLP